MGVVTTEKIHFDGAPFKKVIRCNRDGLFRIKYPSGLVKALGEPAEAVAKTMDAAEKEFGQRLWDYKQARTSTRKVIVYRINMKAKIWRPEDDIDLHRKDISFGVGLGVLVWANVFDETRVQLGESGAHYTYATVQSELPLSIRDSGEFGARVGGRGHKDDCVLEWTAEREAFFCRVAEAMEALCLKLDEMTSDGADGLAQIADTWSGSFLPGPQGKD
jgi:hypothetical protein